MRKFPGNQKIRQLPHDIQRQWGHAAYGLAVAGRVGQKDETHLWKNGTGTDTIGQFDEMNAFLRADRWILFCFHLQHGTLNGKPPAYDLMLSRWGQG